MLLGQISDVLDILAAELQKPLVETDRVLIGLENISSILAVLAAIGELPNEERLFALLKMIIEEVEGSNSMTVMSREQLLFLLESHFRVPEIARIFGVSIRTIRRRMSEYGLSVRSATSASGLCLPCQFSKCWKEECYWTSQFLWNSVKFVL